MKEGAKVCQGRGDTTFPALIPRAYPVQARPDTDEGVHLLLPSSPMPGMPREASHGREGTLLWPVIQWLDLSKEASCGRRGYSLPFLAS